MCARRLNFRVVALVNIMLATVAVCSSATVANRFSIQNISFTCILLATGIAPRRSIWITFVQVVTLITDIARIAFTPSSGCFINASSMLTTPLTGLAVVFIYFAMFPSVPVNTHALISTNEIKTRSAVFTRTNVFAFVHVDITKPTLPSGLTVAHISGNFVDTFGVIFALISSAVIDVYFTAESSKSRGTNTDSLANMIGFAKSPVHACMVAALINSFITIDSFPVFSALTTVSAVEVNTSSIILAGSSIATFVDIFFAIGSVEYGITVHNWTLTAIHVTSGRFIKTGCTVLTFVIHAVIVFLAAIACEIRWALA
jgi:hypothetical protein